MAQDVRMPPQKILPDSTIFTIPTASLPKLAFPDDKILLVTTCNSVARWASSGDVRKIYRSVHDSITASRQATGQTLAVADGRVLILDRAGTARTRYRLKQGEGHASVLAYAKTDEELFFSTSIQHVVLRYSIFKDRLVDWQCPHPSSPTVLALSANSKYAVSSSAMPPATYVSPLDGSTHILLRPHASTAPVTAAAFHPATEEHFVLGYADGTVSVHTASRIVLMRAMGSAGHIGHLRRLHRSTNEHSHRHRVRLRGTNTSHGSTGRLGSRIVGITAVAFMNGCKLRVISVAGDGKCRMIDFERGAQVLRTWSVGAPCVSLAIHSPARGFDGSDDPIPRHIIAVGRTDGRICLFNYLGLLQEERAVDLAHRPIIGLEWAPLPVVAVSSKQPTQAEQSLKVQTPPEPFVWRFASAQEETARANDAFSRSTQQAVPGMPEPTKKVGPAGGQSQSSPARPSPSLQTPTKPKPASTGQLLSSWPKSPSSSSKKQDTRGIDASPTSLPSLHVPKGFNHSQDRGIHPHSAPNIALPIGRASLGPRLDGPSHPSLVPNVLHAPEDVEPTTRRHTVGDVPWTQSHRPDFQRASRKDTSHDSSMPCSWVSDEEHSHDEEEEDSRPVRSQLSLYGSETRKRLTDDERGMKLAALKSPQASKANPQEEMLSDASRSRSSTALLESSAGWQSDAKSSPIRDHQQHKQQRLRRMKLRDDLANWQLGQRTRNERVISCYSPRHVQTPQKHRRLQVGQAPQKSSSTYSDPYEAIPQAASRSATHHNRSSLSPAVDFLPLPSERGSLATEVEEPRLSLPAVVQEASCDCDCVDVIREEMALVRAELASLRKALWVFGGRVDSIGWSQIGASGIDAVAEPEDDQWSRSVSRGRRRRRSSS